MGIYEELKARGLIAQVTDEEQIRDLVNNGKATFYIGFDCTADSLHVGHFMALCLMKRLQMAGNKPIALIGGGTTMIGDPSGRNDMRKMLTKADIDHNAECFKRQMERFIDFGEGKAVMLNNADWLMKLNYIELLREVGACFSVNNMLRAKCYEQRMEKGLSFLEFNYMIMQSYDFYHMFQEYGCNMQFGGDDQWSNMLGGTELIRRKLGKDAQAMTITLLLNSEGKKMGKTASGAVWLDPNKTTPYDFYQYWRNVGDQDVLKCIRMLTFLPLGYCALHAAGKEDKMAYMFTLQTVAANLGGMLTPFGNPQNLYLYNRFSIPTGEFFRIMIFPTLAAVAAIALLCLFVKREPIESHADEVASPDKAKTAVYLVAFAYMIVVVFRVVPYWTAFLVIPLLLVLDRGALAHADYSLLLTFCAFFVFTGNLARISAVDAFFRFLLGKSVLLTGVLCCQAISNVPSAVLLSGFTSDYARLLVAVNIGGCGTLISSMASVISFRNFSLYRPGERLKYLGINAAVNFMCLVALTLFCLFVPIYP